MAIDYIPFAEYDPEKHQPYEEPVKTTYSYPATKYKDKDISEIIADLYAKDAELYGGDVDFYGGTDSYSKDASKGKSSRDWYIDWYDVEEISAQMGRYLSREECEGVIEALLDESENVSYASIRDMIERL